MTVSEQALVQWPAERSCPSWREGLSQPGARPAVIRVPKDCVLSEGSQLGWAHADSLKVDRGWLVGMQTDAAIVGSSLEEP